MKKKTYDLGRVNAMRGTLVGSVLEEREVRDRGCIEGGGRVTCKVPRFLDIVCVYIKGENRARRQKASFGIKKIDLIPKDHPSFISHACKVPDT